MTTGCGCARVLGLVTMLCAVPVVQAQQPVIERDRFADAELVILRTAGENLVYFASPLSQAPTKFPETTVSGTLLVFENPAHDFPKKVSYRRVGTDSLQAWIEGDGRKIPFAYARVRCDTVMR